jgi:hypothetical protein
MLARLPGLDQGLTIIWAGRNNYRDAERVKADIAEMVASLPPTSRYLVLGIINGNYQQEFKGGRDYVVIQQLNAELAAIYGSRFLPIRERILSHAPFINREDLQRDYIPSSLRTDDIHLNRMGYSLVATEVAKSINADR